MRCVERRALVNCLGLWWWLVPYLIYEFFTVGGG